MAVAAVGAYAGRLLGFEVVTPMRWLSSLPVALTLGALIGISPVRLLLPLLSAVLWVLLLAVAYTPLATVAAGSITRTDPLAPAPAIAVLSSGIRPDGTPDAAMRQRLLQAYALLREHRAPRLVLTRLRRPDLSYVPYVRAEMRELGLTQSILETAKIQNTHDEILALRDLAERQGWQRLILVTDPMHSGRACALAREAGLDVLSSPCRYGGLDHERPANARERLGLFRVYLHERWLYHLNRSRGWL